jgi:hypothetical protein
MYLLIITNKICYTIFFATVNALRVSGGISAHQELKNCTHSIGYMLAVAASKLDMCAVCTVFELLTMGRKTT